MRIANVMLSKGGGGIEQAVVDYCRALLLYQHQVISVTPSQAWVNSHLPEAVMSYHLDNWGEWDWLAALRLRRLLYSVKPDAIITHTNRALSLTVKAVKGKIPIIAVAHNYSIRRCIHADAVFTITQDLAQRIIALPVPANRVFHIPNMIDQQPRCSHKVRNGPVVIGTLGRFVKKKGFDVYLHALKILKEEGIEYRGIIGGSGEEEVRLKILAKELGLQEQVEFMGWVHDRAAFYRQLDLFCLPSLHEPFGIVLLEAFSYGVPVVSTDTEGPLEMIMPDENAILVEKGNPAALAQGLRRLLVDEALGEKLAGAAYHRIGTHYTHQVVGKKMHAAIQIITGVQRARGFSL